MSFQWVKLETKFEVFVGLQTMAVTLNMCCEEL